MSAESDVPCPACRAMGKDTAGDNLRIYPSGFHCIAFGDDEWHNRDIIALRPELAPPPTPFCWRELEYGIASDFQKLAQLRNVNEESLKIMSRRGLLRFANFRQGRAYVTTDRSLKNAQARLLSGEEFIMGLGRCKSRSPKKKSGAIHGWPIGISEVASYSSIALVEGVPDFISVLHHAGEFEGLVAPVMMAGAGVRIVKEALPLFAGKCVRIFVHDDLPGKRAFVGWVEQLHSVGAVVDGFSFDGLIQSNGRPVKDLNDLCRLHVDSWEEHRIAVESCMDFAAKGVS